MTPSIYTTGNPGITLQGDGRYLFSKSGNNHYKIHVSGQVRWSVAPNYQVFFILNVHQSIKRTVQVIVNNTHQSFDFMTVFSILPGQYVDISLMNAAGDTIAIEYLDAHFQLLNPVNPS
jgi:hypothetical protein